MDYMAELAAIAQGHGGIIETKTAIAHGISKAMLYKLCREDKIHRIVQGQYILPDDMQDELLSISKRSNQIIFFPRNCPVPSWHFGSDSLRTYDHGAVRLHGVSGDQKRVQGLLHQARVV